MIGKAFSRGTINLRAESHGSVDRAILVRERAMALEGGGANALRGERRFRVLVGESG